MVTTRGGKSTRDPPHPNHAEKAARPQVEEEESPKHDDSEEPEEENPRKTFDTSFLLFASRKQKITVDEQFTRFVDDLEDTCQRTIAGRNACTNLHPLHQRHHQQQATAAHNGGCQAYG